MYVKCADGYSARVDFAIYTTNGLILLEVDERQHKHIPQCKELTRMKDITYTLSTTQHYEPIVWVRYNPHSFRLPVSTRSTCVPQTMREQLLVHVLGSLSESASGLGFGIQHATALFLFYDPTNDTTRIDEYKQLLLLK